MNSKRLFDLLFSILGLLVLAPVFIIISFIIKADSSGPIFFRQRRVGQHGVVFKIHKFRTMLNSTDKIKTEITVGSDPRITKVGAYLRKYKIDELPQIIDVLIGNMSFVGPRPEVEQYVEYYPKLAKEVIHAVKPGITDLASIKFRDESNLLGAVDDPHNYYIKKILPIKLKYCVLYINQYSFCLDMKLIYLTMLAVFSSARQHEQIDAHLRSR